MDNLSKSWIYLARKQLHSTSNLTLSVVSLLLPPCLDPLICIGGTELLQQAEKAEGPLPKDSALCVVGSELGCLWVLGGEAASTGDKAGTSGCLGGGDGPALHLLALGTPSSPV